MMSRTAGTRSVSRGEFRPTTTGQNVSSVKGRLSRNSIPAFIAKVPHLLHLKKNGSKLSKLHHM